MRYVKYQYDWVNHPYFVRLPESQAYALEKELSLKSSIRSIEVLADGVVPADAELGIRRKKL